MPVSQSVVRSAVCAEPLLTRAPLRPLHTSAQGSRFFFFFFKNAIRNGSQIPSAFAFEWVICVDFAGRALKWFDWNLMMNTHDWVLFTISLVHSKFQLRNALVLCEPGTHALTHTHTYCAWIVYSQSVNTLVIRIIQLALIDSCLQLHWTVIVMTIDTCD